MYHLIIDLRLSLRLLEYLIRDNGSAVDQSMFMSLLAILPDRVFLLKSAVSIESVAC